MDEGSLDVHELVVNDAHYVLTHGEVGSYCLLDLSPQS